MEVIREVVIDGKLAGLFRAFRESAHKVAGSVRLLLPFMKARAKEV